MSRIASTFARLRAAGRTAVIPYITVGYPDLATTEELVPALAAAGADLIELGIPFSDPLADGVTIQRASHAALAAGVSPRDCLALASRVRARTDVPLLFMGYYNPILRFGPVEFCLQAASAGIDGLIVPDLPPEEAGELRAAAESLGIDIVFLIAPTSTDERIAAVCRQASGFVYCAALTGVTGARESLGEGIGELTRRARAQTDLPLAVGFGISKPEHFAAIGKIADGAIVGSAVIDRLEGLPAADRVAGTAAYIASLRA